MKQMLGASGALMGPVPIKKATYIQGIQDKGIPGDDRVKVVQELTRVHEVLETFSAWLHPVGQNKEGTVWDVRFPPGSRWRSGPPTNGALAAIKANYERNKYFGVFFAQAKVDPKFLLNADKISDEAVRGARIDQAAAANEEILRGLPAEDRKKLILPNPRDVQ